MFAVNNYFNSKYNKILLENFINNRISSGMYLVTGKFLDMFDKANLLAFNDTFTTSTATSLLAFCNGIFDKTINLDTLITEGNIITSKSAIECHKLTNYNSSYHSMSFDTATSVMTINYSMPLYVSDGGFFRDELNNTLTEQLYLVLYNPTDIGYWNNALSKSVRQTTYVAFTVGDTGTGADLQFDHTDKIEYIDSIAIKVRLPKSLL